MNRNTLFFYFVISAVLITNICFARAQSLLCRRHRNDVAIAQSRYDAYQNFTNFLIQQHIIVLPSQPAYSYFTDPPLNNVDYKFYQHSQFIIILSDTVIETIFKNARPHDSDLSLILEIATRCFTSVFEEFCVNNKEFVCDKNLRYRPIDGFCNSLRYPKEGAFLTAYAALIYQRYDDSMQTVRKTAISEQKLPGARYLSNLFFDSCVQQDIFIENAPNVGSLFFGQLSAHDVSFRNVEQIKQGGPTYQCCKPDFSESLPKNLLHPTCDPIELPKNDPFFQQFNHRCMNFLRSQNAYDNDCLLSSRKQANFVTSMLDLSIIYGSNSEASYKVRAFENGELKTSTHNFFPQDMTNNFFTGDVRFSQTSFLATMHLLFIREHNRICKIIKNINDQLSDEQVFQETRRLVIAEYQHIFLYEWWPIFTNLLERPIAFNSPPYLPPPPTTTNQFAHGSFRQFHRLLPQIVELYNKDGNKILEKPLTDTVGDLNLVLSNFNDLVRAFFYQKINFNECLSEIRNKLFKNAEGIGIDLISIDIQRGRDHGLQPYYIYAQRCLLKIIITFEDLGPEIGEEDIAKLKEIYPTPQDIDMYVGLKLEKSNSLYKFGPTTDCINAEQIYRYTTGDPFFYENELNPYPFKQNQLNEIRKSSFARILCDNSKIHEVPRKAFFPPSYDNPNVDCSNIPTVEVLNI